MVVTPAEVRDELAFDASAFVNLDSDGFDALLQRLIERETERVADALDVTVGVEATTEVTSRPRSVAEHLLPLSDRPVQAVTDVTIDTDRVAGGGVADDGFVVHETHLELLPAADRARWPTDRRSVTVEYDHGVAEDDVPEVVRGAVIGLVRSALQEIEADGLNSESIDGHNVNYELGDEVVGRHLNRARRFDEPEFYGATQIV